MDIEKILSRIKKEDSKFPSVILVDNISYCNLKCFMCPHKEMTRKQGIMNLDLYNRIIDEVALENPQARVWVTFFGEGLILKDLSERIIYAKQKGLKDVVLNSNGNLLNYELSCKIVKSGLDCLYVGIDAYKPDTYEKIRIGGNLDNVIQGVLSYKKALGEYGQPEQKIYVQYVVMDENETELDDFKKFWNENSISVKVRPKVSWAGKVDAPNLIKADQRYPCFWALNTINITDTGLVCLCAVDLDGQVIMGDINKNTIKEVWNGNLKLFREQHINARWSELPEMCCKCNDWQSGYADYY